ncbi:MAG: hypothetical protein ACRENB_13440 [Gemmatimonadales bacterium]
MAKEAGQRVGTAAQRAVTTIKRSRRAQVAAAVAAGMVAAAVGIATKRRRKAKKS